MKQYFDFHILNSDLLLLKSESNWRKTKSKTTLYLQTTKSFRATRKITISVMHIRFYKFYANKVSYLIFLFSIIN